MAYFDINETKIRFKIKYPRFEYILDKLPIEFDDKIDTACTDGEKLYFSREYMNSLDEDQQLFVFAHEVLHVALNHIDRCLDKDMYYWNLATDAVINDYLRDSGLKLTDHCVDIVGALNHTAEEMYEKLKKEDEEKKEDKPKDPPKDSDKTGNGKKTDTPSSGNNDNENDKDKDQNQNGNKNENDDKENQDDNGTDKSNDKNPGHDDHSMWQDAAKKHQEEGNQNTNDVNEKDEFQKNKEQKKKEDDDYLQNGVEGNQNTSTYGTGSGRDRPEGIETIDDSLIPWQNLLKMNYKSNQDWVSGEEVEDGVVISTLEEEESSTCEIVIDTSVSISENLIRNFLIECLSIAKTSKIKVGFFDTRFYGFHEIRDEDDIKNLEIEGGGGTNFDCAVDAFTETCENKIIFTDGEASMPKKEMDATWIVFGKYKNEIKPKGGNVIYINGDEYDALLGRQKTR